MSVTGVTPRNPVCFCLGTPAGLKLTRASLGLSFCACEDSVLGDRHVEPGRVLCDTM